MQKPKGLLVANGTIDIGQFWPDGVSDADTAKILVTMAGASAFTFQPATGGPAKPTNAFVGAFMKGSDSIDPKTGKPRHPKFVINTKSQITVRFQGIDAPELHFKPPHGHVDLRQHFGESSTIALSAFLKTIGPGPLPCRVITRVNKPNDVFDIYGRFIGDVLVKQGTKEININHWLVQHGWAFPSFYDSMMEQEIRDLIALTDEARKKGLNIWAKTAYTTDLGHIDRTLATRPVHSAPAPDKGHVIIPKFYRRQYTWAVDVDRGASTAKNLKQFLLVPSNKDKFMMTDAFLKSLAGSSPKPPMIKLGAAIDDANHIIHAPGDFVIREAGSTLVHDNDIPVTAW